MAVYANRIKKLSEVEMTNKKVFIRSDLNVPLNENGVVLDTTRIESSLKTIRYVLQQRAAVFLTSHLGRPIEGKYDENFSLSPVVSVMERLLKKKFR
tara:strand:+ start:8344 stop:8634 length:291 start_codon:yes stop_codon:yes gene_type:complete